ncbi:hypothetical protein E1293_24365 [Actinomadura darangshiensis]|uniref:WD40 repeat domain-containing protein n=1 Tax=Actinomadura darangshiensis TaxID=705336 RepID=A0A4R5B320_9ACTN|nr:hypothetical protein [Actinomadura darangshiensis]TDD79109.1 hypothetical protein E1293_24365 [Actinomadura darangshiensis]
MTDELGRALRGTLTTAAGEAPAVPPGLLDQVEAGHRRRRRLRVSATALAVAVILGGTGAAGAVLRSGDEPPAAAKPGKLRPVAAAELGKPIKVRDRWPDAVRSLPRKLPNGRPLQPIALVGEDTLIGSTTSSGVADRLWAYDLKAGKATVVTRVDTPRTSYDTTFVAGGGHIAWALARKTGGRTVVEIWAVPMAGGEARKVAEAGSPTSGLVIDGGNAVWETDEGVYKAPLAGGATEKIPGTKGFGIVSWPWLGSPGAPVDKVGAVRFRNLWNVRTGERRTAVLAPIDGRWSCGVTWCVGSPADKTVHRGAWPNAVQRRDGKDGRSLPGEPIPGGMVIADRFVVYRPLGLDSRNMILYDLHTGRLLDTGISMRYQSIKVSSQGEPDGGSVAFVDDGGTAMLDLTAIR